LKKNKLDEMKVEINYMKISEAEQERRSKILQVGFRTKGADGVLYSTRHLTAFGKQS